ncbi:MAG: SusC/RagA family TonB-linked outer membrane protein [Rikenellaceae bacterium]
MKKFFTMLIVTFFTLSADLFAQQVNVTGKVVDSQGAPIIGATALVKGTTTGSITEVTGDFSFKANVGQEFNVSFLGYVTQTFKVESGRHYLVTLVDDAVKVDEVVVVGYGTQKKANLTGAVSQVNMDEVLGSRPVTTVGAALTGVIPGLTITGGAVPGTATSFNIRGYTSINGGGPLILVDNVPADINMINPEDIQSVTVLKDAASTAIYGARAAFGVILVTTKKANKSTKLQINYNDNFAFTKSTNNPEYLSVEDFLNTQLDYDIDGKYHSQGQDIQKWLGYVRQNNAGTLMSENPGAYYKDGRFVPKGESVYYHLLNRGITDSMFDNFGFQQTHNVSATGGSESITYRVSLGYLNNDGPLVSNKDSYSRINVSSYVNADITKWLSTALDIRYSKDDRSYVDKDIYGAFQADFQPIGKIPKSTDLDGPEIWMESPYANIMANDPARFQTENPRIYSKTSVRPIKGLEAVFEYTYDQSNFDKKVYNNPYEMMNLAQGSVGRSSNLSAFILDFKRLV